jgi:hypothetical protein
VWAIDYFLFLFVYFTISTDQNLGQNLNMVLFLIILHKKAEHDSESLMSFYEFTCGNTHKYHTHESQVPMSMSF